jgi:hypothetical protein
MVMSTQSLVPLHIPDRLYRRLQSLSTTRQITPIDLLEVLVTQAEQAEDHLLHRIAALATDLEVPDLAEQHDHYLYGTEKQ